MSAPDFGTDVGCLFDTDPAFSLVSGIPNLARALGRRYITPRGTLDYDPGYGTDLRDYLNDDVSSATVAAAIRADAVSEALKDERVLTANCETTFESKSNALTITITGTSAAGPFFFVFGISNATVDLIEARGA